MLEAVKSEAVEVPEKPRAAAEVPNQESMKILLLIETILLMLIETKFLKLMKKKLLMSWNQSKMLQGSG